MFTIDMHTHTFCPSVEELVAGKNDPQANLYRRYMSEESRATDAANKAIYRPKLSGLDVRRADMQRMGVDFQVVSPAPAQQNYWADEELQIALSRMQNDYIAKFVAADSGHFAAIGTLPMRYPERALEEAVRGVEELGLRGFQIDTRVNAIELSDPMFTPLWSRLEALGAPLFIHPLGFSDGQRLSPFFMVNSVGQPLEELLAAMHMISGGVLDRHPQLKVVVAHGGGYLPFYVGRLDHAWKVRPEVRALTAQPPSAYLSRMWFDTCVFRPDHLSALVDLVGQSRVMLGSDYPFDMGDEDPVAIVTACKTLDAAAREAILSQNARELFKLDI